MSAKLWTLTAAELVRCFKAGEASPQEALEACLSRLDGVNPVLKAVVSVDRASARDAARRSHMRWRAGTPLSSLDGAPVTIKDNIPVTGLRATWGSRLYGDWIPEKDETPVLRLREAAAVILGKTNVPEMTLQGYTSNPLFGSR